MAIADGRLVPVLPEWKLPELVVSAVTQRRDAQPAKVRHALELLAAYFRNKRAQELEQQRLGSKREVRLLKQLLAHVP